MPDDISLVTRAEPPSMTGRAYDGAARSMLLAVCGLSAVASIGAVVIAGVGGYLSAAVGAAIAAGVLLGLGAATWWRRPTGATFDVIAVLVVIVLGAEAVAGIVLTDQVDWSLAALLALAAAGTILTTVRWFVAAVYTVWVGWLAGLAAADLASWPTGWLVAAAAITATAGINSFSRRHLVEELDEVAQSAEQAAVRDPLTGLVNRRGLSLLGQQIVEVARRTGDAVHCIYIDIDQLRHVNEVAGEDSGDDVVVSVSDALRSITRGTDIVARWGGDEFCVIGPGPGMSPVELERRLRDRILLSPPVAIDIWDPKVCAGGAMLAPWDSGTLDTLLGKADQEMYLRRALRRGGSRSRKGASSSDASPTNDTSSSG